MPSSLVPRISRLPKIHQSNESVAMKTASGIARRQCLDIAPDSQNGFPDRAKQERVQHSRARNQDAVPGSNLGRGGHALIEQQPVAKRSQQPDGIEIPQLLLVEVGRRDGPQRFPGVAPIMADGLVKGSEEKWMRG